MATTVVKKNSYCRYFIRYGDCFHGENCQFIHAYPPQYQQQLQQQQQQQQQLQMQLQQQQQHQQTIAQPSQQNPNKLDTPTSTPIHQQQQQNLLSQQQLYQNHQQQLQQQDLQKQQEQQKIDQGLNKLICSFKSDLPNEIDFAMQIATLLANTNNFIWSKDYLLIDAICASLPVFACICGGSLSPCCYCYPRFWHRLLSNSNNVNLQAATLPPDTNLSFINFQSLKDHDIIDHNKIYKRIKSTAELIKQFSMTAGIPYQKKEPPSNNYSHDVAASLADGRDLSDPTTLKPYKIKKKQQKASPSLLKFVSLLYHCNDKSLNLIGLDILSNIASKLVKLPEATNDSLCMKLVQMFQEKCIECINCHDGDIYLNNRSIEVVSKLISNPNKSIVGLMADKNIVTRLVQFLTSQFEVTLFLSALECCYSISRHAPHLLTTSKERHLLKLLVNLLNFDDGRYFSQNALKRIKLVDEQETSKTYTLTTKNTPLISETTRLDSTIPTTKIAPTTNSIAKTNSTPEVPVKEYTCEWNECNMKFTDPKQVYIHVFEKHIGPLPADTLSSCLWSSPEGSGPGCLTKRPKFSLLTHLNDFHCNQMALGRSSNRSQSAIKPSVHPGYAPNAALLAIRRHANSQKELLNSNLGNNLHGESPLSTSVRLTAALILRNLANDTAEMKQALESHESLLSEICMSSNRAEAKIIAECLSIISKDH